MTHRIAMWSGPRNISTAMMRAWENRPDCAVWDEPLYAAYLNDTGIDHPMREEIIAHDDTDWRRVVQQCQHGAPDSCAVFYQKHMTHHMLPEYSLDWLADVSNCFLIRNPHAVLASYLKRRDQATLEDIGLPQQLRIFEHVCATTGSTPLVIDSTEFLQKPEQYLQAICLALDLPFTDHMLSWPAGPRESDGVWAPHWYDQVWASTGFSSPTVTDKTPALPNNTTANALLDEAMSIFEQLHLQAICL
ncbi:MAG: HAD family hydrolase [Burkholderiaceae bacterium]